MGRYYVKDQEILANCGTRDVPDWISGIVIELTFDQHRPYQVRLERASDGDDTWYFPPSCIIDDNPQNRRNKSISAKLTPPQRALADAMSAISERYYCAGWLSGLEYTLWRFLTYPFDGAWGMAHVTEGELDELRTLALDLGGWIVWRDFEDGETFLTFEEWQQEHDAHQWGSWPKWKPLT